MVGGTTTAKYGFATTTTAAKIFFTTLSTHFVFEAGAIFAPALDRLRVGKRNGCALISNGFDLVLSYPLDNLISNTMNIKKTTFLAFKILFGLLILLVLLQLVISIIVNFKSYKTNQEILENGSSQKITTDL